MPDLEEKGEGCLGEAAAPLFYLDFNLASYSSSISRYNNPIILSIRYFFLFLTVPHEPGATGKS